MKYPIGKYLVVLFILIILGVLVTAIEFQFIQNAMTGRPDIVRSTNQSGNNWTADNIFWQLKTNFISLIVPRDIDIQGKNLNNLSIEGIKLTNQSPNTHWNGSLTIITGIAKDGSNISFVVIDSKSNLPNLIIKPVVPSKGSVIVGSLIISSQDINLNSSNATLCQAHADEDGIELKIDCNSTSPTFSGTGADLYVEGDVQVNQQIWLRDTAGEFHFFTRELDLIDELFNNILFNKINSSILGTTLTIISQHIVDTLVVNLEENTTIFTSNSSTVTFVEGTNSSPVENFITYQDANNPVLTRSGSDPSDEHADVVRFLSGDGGRVFGAVIDNARIDEYIHDATKRWFDEGAIYVSGFGMNVSTTSFNITNGGDMVIIINRHSHTKNFSTDTEYFFVRNNGNYNVSLDLNEIDEYGDGGTIGNNKCSNVVFGIVHNDLKPPMLMAVIQNTPSGGEYTKTKDCEVDTDGALTIFPSDSLLKRLFLPIGRVVIKRSGGVNTIQSLSNGEFFIDLRGTVTAAGSSPPSTGITNHANLNNLAWSVAGHTIDETFDTDGNNIIMDGGNITNATIINATEGHFNKSLVKDGVVTAPSMTFTESTNTGFYRSGSGSGEKIHFAVDGVEQGFVAVQGWGIKEGGSANFGIVAFSGTSMTADRQLSIDVNDGARTLDIQGNPVLDNWFDQEVKTTTAVTFDTVNTGQGANELYDMNQNVKTDSTPEFARIGLNIPASANSYEPFIMEVARANNYAGMYLKNTENDGISRFNLGMTLAETTLGVLYQNDNEDGRALFLNRKATVGTMEMITTGGGVKVLNDGNVQIADAYSNDIGTERDLLINSSGDLGYDSSSIVFKENVKNMTNTMSSKIHQLRPITYDKISGAKDQIGLIAEEVNELYPEFISYKREEIIGEICLAPDDCYNGTIEYRLARDNVTGELIPETISYKKLVIPLIQEVQNLKEENKLLEERITKIEEMLNISDTTIPDEPESDLYRCSYKESRECLGGLSNPNKDNLQTRCYNIYKLGWSTCNTGWIKI